MQEQWIRWEPVIGLEPKYYIESIVNNFDGLTIVLADVKNDKSKIHVVFDGWIIAYRWADELYMHHRVQSLFRDYGSKLFCNWTFFKVINSEYRKYISETSGTISDHMLAFTHFAIFTDDALFEILYCYQPEVKFINVP